MLDTFVGHTAVGEVEEAVDEEEGGGTDFEGAVGSDGDGVEEGGGPSDPLLFVEEHALQHYEENGGWRGLHCEGSPIITLFGILMWDLLFLPLPDVFLTQFQDGYAAPDSLLSMSPRCLQRLIHPSLGQAALHELRVCPWRGSYH